MTIGVTSNPTEASTHVGKRSISVTSVALTLLATGIAIVVALGLQAVRPPMWHSSATLIVSPGRGAAVPSTARDASDLALTYAQLLPQDPTVVAAVAKVTHQSPSTVRKAMTVRAQPNTALMKISYSARSSSVALAGARAFADAVAGKKPVSPLIGAGTIAPVSLPAPDDVSRASTTRALLTAGFIGCVLGVVLALSRRRASRPITDSAALASALDCPVQEDVTLSPRVAELLMNRWSDLSQAVSPRVALLAVDASASAVSSVLKSFAERGLPRLKPAQHGPREHDNPRGLITAAPVTSRDGFDEQTAEVLLEADLIVLAVPVGLSADRLDQVLRQLAELGVAPSWAFLTHGSATRRRAGTQLLVPEGWRSGVIGDRGPSRRSSAPAGQVNESTGQTERQDSYGLR